MQARKQTAAWLVATIAMALLAGVLTGVGLDASTARSADAAGFNANLLMSDAMFDATGTMTTSDIQTFLNRYPNSCLRNYKSSLPLDYSTVGAKVSAAQVISASATMYGLNPQVLLVTLEKEQGLVTGNAGCAGWRYWSAMGYACPDGGARYNYPKLGITGTCVSAERHAGFTAQVNHGSWQLQFNRQRAIGNLNWRGNQSTPNYGFYTKGYRRQMSGAPSIYYDGWATIDGKSVYMTNGVTATLYTYTPHLSANQAFATLFTNWFGSPTGTPMTAPTKTPPTTVAPPKPFDTALVGTYIDNVYRLFLGRTAAQSEKDWWYTYINTGRSWPAFVNAVTGSSEARSYQVLADYVIVLHRAPDSGGLASWSAALAGSGRNDTIMAALAGSGEYFRNRAKSDTTTFVGDLYQDLLGRHVDPGGLTLWTGRLTAGTMTRTQVAFAILQSNEFATYTVRQSYLRVLGRVADPGGLSHWTAQYLNRHSVGQVQGSLAASSEGVSYLSIPK